MSDSPAVTISPAAEPGGSAAERLPTDRDGLYDWPRWALHRRDAPALIRLTAAGRVANFTWLELAVRIERLSTSLQQADFAPGDRLLHTEGNSVGGVLVALASAAIGTVEVPLEPESPESETSAAHQAIARRLGGRMLPTDLQPLLAPPAESRSGAPSETESAAAVSRLTERYSRRGPDEPTLILFTSGTGGASKAVTLSRRNLATNAEAKLAAVPQSPDDVRLTLLPIRHAYARTCDLGTWLLSGSALAVTLGWDGWTRWAPILRPTLVNTVPSVADRLLQLPADCPSISRLRLLGCGGAALPNHHFDRFRARGITVIQGYGLTEASPVICSATPDDTRAGFVGRPVAGWQTRVDPDGRLWVRGDGVMLGYWGDPEATASRIRDGWLDTGDLVAVDPGDGQFRDGQFRILGRADERIVLSNGYKVDPAPIERRLAGLPGVRHALLFPRGRHLELWLDADASLDIGESSDLKRLLDDLPLWQRPRQIRYFARPLADMPGMLTAKLTPIRSQVRRWIQDTN